MENSAKKVGKTKVKTSRVKSANVPQLVQDVALMEQTNNTVDTPEVITALVEKKQIKIGDEFICKGGKFENKADIFVCRGLDGLTKVGGFKKFTETGELQNPLEEYQIYIFETSEIKSFKSLVLVTESQVKVLDKIETFVKSEATSIQKLRHVSNVCKVEQMGLNKCLKLFLSRSKDVLTKKQTDLLKFDLVLEYIKESRFRFNQLYTLNHMVLICNDILKIHDFKTKASDRVAKQGGLIGAKADATTK